MNVVVLSGRIVGAPRIKNFSSGGQVCSFGIAQSGEELIQVETWGELAERFQLEFSQGEEIGVEGRLVRESWTRNGRRFSKLKLKAFSIVKLVAGSSMRRQPTVKMR